MQIRQKPWDPGEPFWMISLHSLARRKTKAVWERETEALWSPHSAFPLNYIPSSPVNLLHIFSTLFLLMLKSFINHNKTEKSLFLTCNEKLHTPPLKEILAFHLLSCLYVWPQEYKQKSWKQRKLESIWFWIPLPLLFLHPSQTLNVCTITHALCSEQCAVYYPHVMRCSS